MTGVVKGKARWQRVDGVLLLDKPQGLSSNGALQAVRRLFRAAKAGHTGTLDPMASGLLPLCFGDATKFAADLLDADKTYLADLAFGSETDTGDADGLPVSTHPLPASRDLLEPVLERFRGPISQIPPMYSALKRDGRPLYELARQGVTVDRAARAVVIHELHCRAIHGNASGQISGLQLEVSCSKGTYIRVLAQDIGRALGSGAHLVGLRRTRVGNLQLAAAHTLGELEALPEATRKERLLGVDVLAGSLPAWSLSPGQLQRFSHGNPVHPQGLDPAGTLYRVYGGEGGVNGEHRFLGLGLVREDGGLWPRRLIQSEAVPTPEADAGGEG